MMIYDWQTSGGSTGERQTGGSRSSGQIQTGGPPSGCAGGEELPDQKPK